MPNIAIYSQKNGDEIQAYLHQFILELEKRENVQIFLHEKILEKNSLLGKYQIFSDKNSLKKCEIDYFFSFWRRWHYSECAYADSGFGNPCCRC